MITHAFTFGAVLTIDSTNNRVALTWKDKRIDKAFHGATLAIAAAHMRVELNELESVAFATGRESDSTRYQQVLRILGEYTGREP